MTAPDPFAFLESVEQFTAPARSLTTLATVDSVTAAGALVVFDGESVAAGKRYKYLAGLAPTAGDRVLMIRAGSSWVIVGALS